MTSIVSINNQWIKKLEFLFSESFGEEITLDDEIDYFQEINPENWFVAINDDNNPIGYIRYFPIDSDNNVDIELYAKNDINIEQALIKKFDDSISNKTVRFCLKKTRNDLINYLSEIGYTNNIKEFQAYSYSEKKKTDENSSVRFASQDLKDISEVKEILKEFQDFSQSKLTNLINENKIVIYEKDNQIIGAALNNLYDEYLEIVEITVKNGFRGKGYGKELLEGIMSKYPDKNLTLKVDKENISAIKLYKKTGFHQEIEKSEIWISKTYN